MRSDNRSKDSIDLDQTIEFSKDDLRKMRRPNRRHLDSDYFDRQIQKPEHQSFEPLQEDSGKVDETSHDRHARRSKTAVDGQGFETDDDIWEDPFGKAPLEYKDNEDDHEMNPFIYHSRSKELRAQMEYERALREEEQRAHRDRFKKKFDDMYASVYDEEAIKPDEHFNQFTVKEADDEASVSTSPLQEGSPAFSFSSLIQSIKDKFVRTSQGIQEEFEEALYDDEGDYDNLVDREDFDYEGNPHFIKDNQKDAEESDIVTPEERIDAEFVHDSFTIEDSNLGALSDDSKASEVFAIAEEEDLHSSLNKNLKNEARDLKKYHIKAKRQSKAQRAPETPYQDWEAKVLNSEIDPSQEEEPPTEKVASSLSNGRDESEDDLAKTSSIDVEAILDAIEAQPNMTKDDLERFRDEMSKISQDHQAPIVTDQLIDDGILAEEVVIEEKTAVKKTHAQESFLKGTMWLSAGNIISRILGALYVIPWAMWFGDEYLNANGLYSIGYRSYALFLAISTAGFPSAIAKQMAYFQAKKEYRVADKLFKTSMLIMLGMGVVTSMIFYFIAPVIAQQSSTDNPVAATIVIRSLAPALLILPVMSMLRGYFQGFNDMIPTAISQIIEQVARIIYMLVMTYVVMKLMTGDVTMAVAHSTFAAFVGGALSLVYLGMVFLKRYPAVKRLIEVSSDNHELNLKESIFVLLKDSIPFILLGSGIIIAQNIDQFTFKQILVNTSLLLESEISQLFGVMSLDVDKLIMIIISIAVGMSLSTIPLISSLFARQEKRKAASLIENIILLFLLIMLPASLGMASIANNMYHLFYANGHDQGPALLVTASYLSIILGAYTIVSTILQSMNYRRLAMKYLGIGLIVKLLLQFPFVAAFHAHGALVATLIAFLVTTTLMLLKIHRLVAIDFKAILPDILVIVAASLVMAINASMWNGSLDRMFGSVGRLATFGKIMVTVILSGITYVGILGLFGKLHLLLGDKYKDLQEELRIFS